jgi:hypothetical protein
MSNNPPFSSEDQQPNQNNQGGLWGGLTNNRLMGSLWGATSKALETGTWAISSVGTKVQEKLDQTGITENVSYVVSSAAESTKNLGSAIMTTTS